MLIAVYLSLGSVDLFIAKDYRHAAISFLLAITNGLVLGARG
jgi:hypothetical protein